MAGGTQRYPACGIGIPAASIMKIHIELEVAPDEVPMATELLAVLRCGELWEV